VFHLQPAAPELEYQLSLLLVQGYGKLLLLPRLDIADPGIGLTSPLALASALALTLAFGITAASLTLPWTEASYSALALHRYGCLLHCLNQLTLVTDGHWATLHYRHGRNSPEAFHQPVCILPI